MMSAKGSGAFEDAVESAIVGELDPGGSDDSGSNRKPGDRMYEERPGELDDQHAHENAAGRLEEEGRVLGGGVQVGGNLGLEATVHFAQIVHVGRSYGLTAIMTLLFMLALPICGVGGAGFVGGACAGYPVAVAISFWLYRRWGSRMGAPPDLTPPGVVFAGMAVVLVVSGQVVAGLLAGAAAMLLSGWSAGSGLAVLAADRGLSLLEALREVRRLERAARAESWLAVIGGVRWEEGAAGSARGSGR